MSCTPTHDDALSKSVLCLVPRGLLHVEPEHLFYNTGISGRSVFVCVCVCVYSSGWCTYDPFFLVFSWVLHAVGRKNEKHTVSTGGYNAWCEWAQEKCPTHDTLNVACTFKKACAWDLCVHIQYDTCGTFARCQYLRAYNLSLVLPISVIEPTILR